MKFPDIITAFVKKHRISVLSVLLASGDIHGASLHYAWDETNGVFVFFTRTSTAKYQALEKAPSKASLVIGFSEEEFCTLQSRGEARVCKNDSAKQAYCEKYRHILDFLRNSDAAFLEFEPHWYRFSDIKASKPVIISSNEGTNESEK